MPLTGQPLRQDSIAVNQWVWRTVVGMPTHYSVYGSSDREFDLAVLPSDMRDRHTHEWHRYVIYGPDFYGAGRIAAQLGWWLHCWDWVAVHKYAITDQDTPVPWASWRHYAVKGEPVEQA